MKKYEAYKNSGVDWCPEIPSKWGIKKGKYIGTITHGVSYTPDDIKDSSGGILVMRASNIQNSAFDFSDNVYISPAKIPSSKLIKKGDIIICATNGSLALVGKSAVSQEDMLASFGTFMIRFRVNQCPSFIQYQLSRFVDVYRGLFATTTINQLTTEHLEQMLFFLPPIDEQTHIAAYLDHKIGQIDKSISEIDSQIDSLKTYRQSVISEAVTKGLGKNAKMKDSGIEWIGEIPEGWNVSRLKNVVSCNDDALPETYDPETLIRYVEISDVNLTDGVVGSTEYMFKEAPSRARRITKKGDVVISTVRTYLRAIATINEDGLIVSTGFAVLRAKKVNSEFLSYAVQSEPFIGSVIANSRGVSYPAINASELVNLPIAIPPVEEQQEIASYLKTKSVQVDDAIKALDAQRNNLNALKQSIISETVTGKIDVRDWKPSEEQ